MQGGRGAGAPTDSEDSETDPAVLLADINAHLAGGSKPAHLAKYSREDLELLQPVLAQSVRDSPGRPLTPTRRGIGAGMSHEPPAMWRNSAPPMQGGRGAGAPTDSEDSETDPAVLLADINTHLAGGPKPAHLAKYSREDLELLQPVLAQSVRDSPAPPRRTGASAAEDNDAAVLLADINAHLAGGPKPAHLAKYSREDLELLQPVLAKAVGDSPANTMHTIVAGAQVRIRKEGTFNGRLAIVVNPNWDGKVKIKLDGIVKSYNPDELEAIQPSLQPETDDFESTKFVQLMQMQTALTETRELYKQVDTDGDGELSVEEISNYLNLQVAENGCSQEVAAKINQYAQMTLDKVTDLLSEVMARLATKKARFSREAALHVKDKGGVYIGKAHIPNFDVARFMRADTTASVHIPSTKAVIFENTHDYTDETSVKNRIAIIDLGGEHQNGDPGALFPCELALRAQQNGASAVIFVYGDEHLRRTLLPLSPLDTVCIPVVAITMGSTNELLVRYNGRLYFDKKKTGERLESRASNFGMNFGMSSMDDADGEEDELDGLLDTEGKMVETNSLSKAGFEASVTFDKEYLQGLELYSLFGEATDQRRKTYQDKVSYGVIPTIEVGDHVTYRCEVASDEGPANQVRKTPSWPRSWVNFSLL
jgi:hypothetical protein